MSALRGRGPAALCCCRGLDMLAAMSGSDVRWLMVSAVTLTALLISACGGGTSAPTATETPAETATPSPATATVEGVSERSPVSTEAAVLVRHEDGSATFVFENLEASFTIPVGALPEGRPLDEITAEWIGPMGESSVVAHFRFGPDGLAFGKPAALRFKIGLRPGQFLGGLVVEGGLGSVPVPLPLSDEASALRIVRASADEVWVATSISHFSEYLFVRTKAGEVRAGQTTRMPLAVTYSVGADGEAVLNLELFEFEAQFQIRRQDHCNRLWTPMLGPFRGADRKNARPVRSPWTMPLSAGPGIRLGPISLVKDYPDVLGFQFTSATWSNEFVCDARGDFWISTTTSVHVYVLMTITSVIEAADGSVRDSVGRTRTEEAIEMSSVPLVSVWLSECVGVPPASPPSPISDPDQHDEDTPTPVPPPPTPTSTASPTPTSTNTPGPSELEQQVGQKTGGDGAVFNVKFTGGTCATYVLAYTQDVTIRCAGNACTLTQGTHIDPGFLNFDTGQFLLENPGVERYEGVMVIVNGKLLISGDYTFFQNAGPVCTYKFDGEGP